MTRAAAITIYRARANRCADVDYLVPQAIMAIGYGLAGKGSPVNRYMLFVKIDGKWEHSQTIEAASHPDALRKAISVLPEEHYDKPIKLEQEDTPPPA